MFRPRSVFGRVSCLGLHRALCEPRSVDVSVALQRVLGVRCQERPYCSRSVWPGANSLGQCKHRLCSAYPSKPCTHRSFISTAGSEGGQYQRTAPSPAATWCSVRFGPALPASPHRANLHLNGTRCCALSCVLPVHLPTSTSTERQHVQPPQAQVAVFCSGEPGAGLTWRERGYQRQNGGQEAKG